jgi:mRNA interferase MazF
MDMVNRFDVYWANLDPTIGSEMKKTRPVIVVSPDVMNRNLKTVIVCPLTTSLKNYPTRVQLNIGGKEGAVALDHIRSIDKERLVKRITSLSQTQIKVVQSNLLEMFK